METEKRWISSEALFLAVSEQLAEHRQAVFTVTGMSMWPFLCHGRDSVIVEAIEPYEVKKGDIVLFRTSANQYLLHRITKCNLQNFQSTGDGNCHRDGFYSYDCIIARAVKLVRPKQTIDCQAFQWKIIFKIWMWLFPVRKQLFTLWSRVRRYFRNK